MIYLKTEEEINLIKVSAQVLGKAHAEVATWVKPGVTTGKLDAVAEEYIRDNGGIPSFKGFNKFPASLCISVNEVVVHGIPGGYVLKEGDIVSIDCGVKLNGYHSDSAYTYPVGEVSKEVMNLLTATKKSLYKGIEQAVDGLRIGDIGHAVQSFVEDRGYTVVRELVGHGVGRDLHEAPEVPNYGKRGKGIRLREGMVLAIEPMINLGAKGVVQERDGWTIRTNDRKYSAHFEHTVVVRKGKAEILTTFDYIEKVTANTSLMVEVQ
ncbi:methionyl aminopeptidase [Dyadobacter sp. BE34]|uniref:Methionine aminopeptidase n=1 Tax=Dyadobacter fermentans TaxID=94254 RepID=A0ABU1QSR2_9BACT|nr:MULTISPECIES: type I methionyl aminopeptidase [Dyadobacter]MDR6803320.1 methionyl aminopeptidase [Dyadobacter fermentans]MDR7041061.1 methionyl aminopeptidase [Dyadobacter sp. BE242]MDR7195464.1 methionyl aminopeptidase [Dyadobacter sp. BE34]MDR7213991.1 methionyl aminopeptidase [Dyadobacter sp. BE31]MDR7260871.1 methionyl aminopeptidase [Dyadobacter sp. BE32]